VCNASVQLPHFKTLQSQGHYSLLAFTNISVPSQSHLDTCPHFNQLHRWDLLALTASGATCCCPEDLRLVEPRLSSDRIRVPPWSWFFPMKWAKVCWWVWNKWRFLHEVRLHWGTLCVLRPTSPTLLIRKNEESPSRMYDDLDDLTHADYDVDEWFPKDGSHDRDWVIKSRY
jgi:hypothetical protein